MQIKKAIPHLFTLGNLACGCLAIYFALHEGNLISATAFVFAGMFLDFFDGLAARLLKVPGEFGKQLDSLADMVTFGVAPAALIFIWLTGPQFEGTIAFEWAGISVLLALFSALRLAKFNIDTRQTTSFMGLATPANAVFWISLPLSIPSSLVVLNYPHLQHFSDPIFDPWWVLVLIPVFSLLMVLDLPLFALKIKNLKWKDNQIQIIFLGLILITLFVCFAVLKNLFAAFPIIVVLYIVLSLINNAFKKSDEV